MDNRRVIHSYREKQAASTSSTPYARSTKGLFSKMKQYFTPASLWSEEVQDKQPQASPQFQTQSQSELQSKPQSRLYTQLSDTTDSLQPFKFPEPELKTPLKLRSESVSKTPNHVLSSFFQSKGDRPLTEVEYEGVVALLSKSHQTTPSTVKKPQTNQERQSHTPSHIHSTRNDIKLGPNNDRRSSEAAANNSNLFVTPYNSKVLKNDSTIFSTPEYKPIYHSVNDNSFVNGRGHGMSSIPSVKRVYQFSGLPSPYRTRIRTPSLSAKKKKISKSNASFASNGTFNSSLSNNVTAPPTSFSSSKPLSNTANTLLSILDGDNESNEANIKEFTSPFARQKRINKDRENESTPMKKRMTAADIEKTISFDQSEKLPEVEKVADVAEKKVEKQTSHANGLIKEETKKSTENLPQPAFAFPNSLNKPLQASETTKSNPSATTTNSGTFTLPNNIPSSNTPIPASTEKSTNVQPAATNSLFGQSAKLAAQTPKVPTSNGINGSNGSNGNSFSFGVVKKIANDGNPIAPTNSSGKPQLFGQSPAFVFELPEQQQVLLDQKKVESYKSLFEF